MEIEVVIWEECEGDLGLAGLVARKLVIVVAGEDLRPSGPCVTLRSYLVYRGIALEGEERMFDHKVLVKFEETLFCIDCCRTNLLALYRRLHWRFFLLNRIWILTIVVTVVLLLVTAQVAKACCV